MSVALPKASVVFGSVTPPQGDIIDLQVHLGCSAEISSFECLLQNWDKKHSPGGTYPINVGDNATISLGRDPNCPSLLTGKVEEIEPLSTATENCIRVKGRCNGEHLFRRLVTKSWDSVKGEVVVKYVIDNYTSLSHVRSGTELIEDTDTTYTHLEYEDTPVFDIIKYIAETADKAGVIGYDFRIAPDGKFEFFPKNSKTSSVSLSERLEVSEYAKNIHRIKNKITVYGAAEASRPPNVDDWTETLTNWSASEGTLSLFSLMKVYGNYSIKCESTTKIVNFKRTFNQVKNPQTLSFWICDGGCGYITSLSYIRLLAPDESNYFELLASDFPAALLNNADEWLLEEIALGKGNTYDAGNNPNGKWTKTGSPSWRNLQGIKFKFEAYYTGVDLLVDGIQFRKTRFEATREDSASQVQYGLREKVETDEELCSDSECDYRAKALLDFLKGPIETLKVRSEVIDYGTTPVLAGDKIHVTIPNENIDADYKVISVEYKASGREQAFDVELELAKEPQLLADFIYGFRKSIQKLDKYKASATAIGAAVSGGGGGGGMSQHGNEYHDPDMALATHNHNLADLAEKSHASLTNVTADQHHPQAHTLASHSSKDHSELTNVLADQHADTKVRSKVVDEANIGNDRILVYKTTGDKLVYEDKPSGGGTPESIIFGTIFQTFSGLDIQTTGGSTGYSVTKRSWGAQLATGTTLNYSCYARYDFYGGDFSGFFSKNIIFECLINLDYAELTDAYILIGTVSNPATSGQRKFGIRIYQGALRIVSSDGTTQSESSDLMTLSSGVWYRVKCKLTAGSNIEVWVDGISKGTKSNNLPSGTLIASGGVPFFYVKTLESGVSHVLEFLGLRVMRDY